MPELGTISNEKRTQISQKQLICADIISVNHLFQRHQRPIFRSGLCVARSMMRVSPRPIRSSSSWAVAR